MIVIDVNVLVAAHMRAHPHHGRALPFLEEQLRAGAVIVPDLVWVGFLRVVTNRRVFEDPSTPAQAVAFVRDVVAAPGYRVKTGTVLSEFLDLITESDSSANLVPDAYIASVARMLAAPVATFDRDFRRFDDLRITTPE